MDYKEFNDKHKDEFNDLHDVSGEYTKHTFDEHADIYSSKLKGSKRTSFVVKLAAVTSGAVLTIGATTVVSNNAPVVAPTVVPTVTSTLIINETSKAIKVGDSFSLLVMSEDNPELILWSTNSPCVSLNASKGATVMVTGVSAGEAVVEAVNIETGSVAKCTVTVSNAPTVSPTPSVTPTIAPTSTPTLTPTSVTYQVTDIPEWVYKDNAVLFVWGWTEGFVTKWYTPTLIGSNSLEVKLPYNYVGFLVVRCAKGTTTPDWEIVTGDSPGRIYHQTLNIMITKGTTSYKSPEWISHPNDYCPGC